MKVISYTSGPDIHLKRSWHERVNHPCPLWPEMPYFGYIYVHIASLQ